MPMKCYWVSSNKMTVCVDVDGGVIVKAAPIVRKFIGQPLANLVRWLNADVVEITSS